MAKHKDFEPYEEPKGSGQWFFNSPGGDGEFTKVGPYESYDHADFDAGEALAEEPCICTPYAIDINPKCKAKTHYL